LASKTPTVRAAKQHTKARPCDQQRETNPPEREPPSLRRRTPPIQAHQEGRRKPLGKHGTNRNEMKQQDQKRGPPSCHRRQRPTPRLAITGTTQGHVPGSHTSIHDKGGPRRDPQSGRGFATRHTTPSSCTLAASMMRQTYQKIEREKSGKLIRGSSRSRDRTYGRFGSIRSNLDKAGRWGA